MASESILGKKERLQKLLIQVDTMIDQLCATIGNNSNLMEVLQFRKDNPMYTSSISDDEEFGSAIITPDFLVTEISLKVTYYLIIKRGLELQLGEMQ